MNSQEIVDYVMNTPHNTNPAILKSMIDTNSSGDGVTSWNDLTDKPFGEVATGGDTIEWDGNTEGLVSDSFGEAYKLTDATPSLADLRNGYSYTRTHADGSEDIATFNSPMETEINPGEYLLDMMWLITEDYVGEQFPEPGLYVMVDSNWWFSRITIPGYSGFPGIKTIDPKYLPVLTVNFHETDDGGVTADKTVDEVLDAIADGYHVVGIYYMGSMILNMQMQYSMNTDEISGVMFTCIAMITESGIMIYRIAGEQGGWTTMEVSFKST